MLLHIPQYPLNEWPCAVMRCRSPFVSGDVPDGDRDLVQVQDTPYVAPVTDFYSLLGLPRMCGASHKGIKGVAMKCQEGPGGLFILEVE
jgi:hypothetical protein